MSNTMTPYAAAKLVNEQLKDMGIERVLPPQMLYTYVNKGYITATVVEGKKRVTHEDLATWFAKYVTKTYPTKVEVTAEVEVVHEDDGTIGEWTEDAEAQRAQAINSLVAEGELSEDES